MRARGTEKGDNGLMTSKVAEDTRGGEESERTAMMLQRW